MRQCDNGHFYDESRFDSCPYCQEGAGVGKTVAAGTVGKTVAAVPGGAAPEADREEIKKGGLQYHSAGSGRHSDKQR